MSKNKIYTEIELKVRSSERHKKNYQKHKAERAEKAKKYYQEHKEEILEKKKQYYQEHKNKKKANNKQYYNTPIGKARYLFYKYKQSDKKYNRGEGDLTAEWIVENIFTKPCHYCGESDWHKIGCDRIDNSKGHTKDNVVPCCSECNIKRGTMEYNEFIKQANSLCLEK